MVSFNTVGMQLLSLHSIHAAEVHAGCHASGTRAVEEHALSHVMGTPAMDIIHATNHVMGTRAVEEHATSHAMGTRVCNTHVHYHVVFSPAAVTIHAGVHVSLHVRDGHAMQQDARIHAAGTRAMLHRARRPATHATSRPVRLPAMIPVRVRPAGKPVGLHVLRHAKNPVCHEVRYRINPFLFLFLILQIQQIC
jgi:hypothetical protein